jgi:hypothetical protein
MAGQQLRPPGVAVAGELEGLGVVTFGGGHVDAHGPVTGQHQVADRPGGSLSGEGIPGRAGKVESGGVVGGEDLGVIGGPLPRHGLDPGRRALVALHTLGARNLRITHFADQRVGEGVFGLACHGRSPGGADEFFACQLMQHCPDFGFVMAAHIRDGAGPEDLAQHRGVLQQPLALGGEGIEPGRDQPLHLRRQRDLPVRFQPPPGTGPGEDVLVLQQPHELFRVQRVAAGTL